MKKLTTLLASMLLFATAARADYTMVIPKEPGGGTAVWAAIVAKELQKYLDEPIELRHIPGQRDTLGFNKFHNELQHNPKTIMISSGTNSVAFLSEDNTEFDFRDYDAVGIMNLTILVGAKTNMGDVVKFPAGGGGHTPDAMAIAMLVCGPNKTTQEYISCFKERVVYVKGYKSQNEFRMAYKRDELNAIRENPAAWKKNIDPEVAEGKSQLWFHHGLLDDKTGNQVDDPNYPGKQFEDVFKAKWGVAPSGDFYQAYKLVKSFRDGLQKAIWIKKGSPDRAKIMAALEQVATNPESIAAIQKNVGKYGWLIGDAANKHRDAVLRLVTLKELTTLNEFVTQGLGVHGEVKKNLVK